MSLLDMCRGTARRVFGVEWLRPEQESAMVARRSSRHFVDDSELCSDAAADLAVLGPRAAGAVLLKGAAGKSEKSCGLRRAQKAWRQA
jgi:hypothetical protein